MILSSTTLTDVTAAPSIMEAITFRGNVDTTDYPLADRLRNINKWRHNVATWIWQSSSDWEYDDTNYGNLPIATTTIVNNQRDYTLPTNLIKIKRVEVLSLNGKWVKLKYVDEQMSPNGLDNEDAGAPTSYALLGNSIILYPKPNTELITEASGLRVYLSRSINEFTNEDADEDPGFTANFHDIIVLGAVYEWEAARRVGDKNATMAEIMAMKSDLQGQYNKRNSEHRVGLRPKTHSYD